MIKRSQSLGKTAHFVVPRRQLIDQMSENFSKFNIDHSFIAAGYPFREDALTHICSLDTVMDKDIRQPDVTFVDETHYGRDKIIQHCARLERRIIGLSATPMFMSGKPMGDLYDDMVVGPSVEWLIANKRLSNFNYFAPTKLDLSGVNIDKPNELSDFMTEKKAVIGNAADHYKKTAMGKLDITFCVDIKHSQFTAERFRDAGITAVHVDGKTPDDERARIFKAFARREILRLTCASLLVFGFDLEAATGGIKVTVESMTDLDPTHSLPKQMQKWGRTLRAKPYPAIISDHVGNYLRHGLPDFDREWTLAGGCSSRDADGKPIPTTQCPSCYLIHRPTPVCPRCGHERPVQERKLNYMPGDLAMIRRDEAQKAARAAEDERRRLRREEGAARSLGDFEAIARARGYHPKWALHKARARGYV